MRIIEFVQTGYDGGFPDTSHTFHHGESLALVSKLDLADLLAAADTFSMAVFSEAKTEEITAAGIVLDKALREWGKKP